MNIDTLHHANITFGSVDSVINLILDLGIETANNPDFWHREFETFGVDDARDLKYRESKKAIGGGRKFFIISTTFITSEAQNALLKLFEEPTVNTHIFLVVPGTYMLLPTLLSRMQILELENSNKIQIDINNFVKSSIADRLEILKDIIENKDKARALDFLTELERYLSDNVELNKDKIKTVLEMKQSLYYRSPQVKSILEYISHSI